MANVHPMQTRWRAKSAVAAGGTGALLYAGVHTALAVQLFRRGGLTSARAAKLARMSLPRFLSHLGGQGIAAVDDAPAE